MTDLPSPLVQRLVPVAPFAERLGVALDVLRQDDLFPAVVMIGGVAHTDQAALAHFEQALLFRAWGEEVATNRARLARRRAAKAVAPASVPETEMANP